MLRDQNDWWLRDQSQLAIGFEHWPLAEEWLGNQASSPVAPSHAGISNGVHGVVSPGSAVGPNGFGNGNGNGNVNGSVNGSVNGNVNGIFGGASGFGGSIGGYNENEWYS